ncbi:unnamed protein product [Heterobilharzia americana]|nr:unnamed protein product [Heterobilharzia americana]CAH8560677.1 unnamed protein product [Heterobilharzia americana]
MLSSIIEFVLIRVLIIITINIPGSFIGSITISSGRESDLVITKNNVYSSNHFSNEFYEEEHILQEESIEFPEYLNEALSNPPVQTIHLLPLYHCLPLHRNRPENKSRTTGKFFVNILVP